MDERIWTDRAPAVGESVAIGAHRLSRGQAPFLTVVSGNLSEAINALSPNASMLGLLENAASEDFAIRIARDRAILVTRSEPGLNGAWHDAGFAMSRADDAYVPITISGPEPEFVVSYGLASPLPSSSPSAATRFASTHVLITRSDQDIVLWVAPAALTYVTNFLVTATSPITA